LKVIIPVAGIGKRLRPQTHTAPKALLHVAGKPLLGHILDSLKDLKFDEALFVTGFLGEKIIKFVENNYKFKVRYMYQEELLGLGYAINLAIDEDETDDLLIVLGDTIVETDWNHIVDHDTNMLGVKQVEDAGWLPEVSRIYRNQTSR